MSASVSQLPFPELSEASTRETIIQARRGWIAVDWAEMSRQRELLFFLIWRDIKVRYKQAVLGFLWVVLQPIINVIVFSAIFGAGLNLASKLGSQLGNAYPVFVFSGLIPWMLFSRSINEGGMSLVNQQHLLTKIYFPRLFVPSAAVGSAMFDMLVSLPVFAAMMWYYHVTPNWGVLLLPLLMALSLILSMGMAYLLSALTVTYRDFRFLIQFVVQILMWVSFIMIPVPDAWNHKPIYRIAFGLNPIYGIVSAYRKVLMGLDRGWDPWNLVSATVISLAVFTLGLFYFRRTERRFADIA